MMLNCSIQFVLLSKPRTLFYSLFVTVTEIVHTCRMKAVFLLGVLMCAVAFSTVADATVADTIHTDTARRSREPFPPPQTRHCYLG